jgi:hypothetical protein
MEVGKDRHRTLIQDGYDRAHVRDWRGNHLIAGRDTHCNQRGVDTGGAAATGYRMGYPVHLGKTLFQRLHLVAVCVKQTPLLQRLAQLLQFLFAVTFFAPEGRPLRRFAAGNGGQVGSYRCVHGYIPL